MGLLPWLVIVLSSLFFAGSSGLVNFFPTTQVGLGSGIPGSAQCQPEVEIDETLKIILDAGQQARYPDHESYTWIRIKKDAAVPGWKVLGNESGTAGAEMEKIGISESEGKDVYTGIGHCGNPADKSDPNCVDPLVQDAVFIPSAEGAKRGDPEWPNCANSGWDVDTDGDGKQDIIDDQCMAEPGYWWLFNVYIREDRFADHLGNPLPIEDKNLPCWTKLACGTGDVWGNERDRLWQKYLSTGVCPADQEVTGASVSVGASALGKYPSFINKDQISILLVADPFIVDQIPQALVFYNTTDKTPEGTPSELIGTFESDYNVYYLVSGSTLTLVKQDGTPPYYNYTQLSNKDIPSGSSLQLGTFQPAVGFAYEWWTPACKPAIYLYPETTTDLNVKVIPQGMLTKTIPSYPVSGWDVTANPSGQIKSMGKDYPYLFYEANIEKIKVPKEGWVVKIGELEDFFGDLLPKLGLNEQEQADFTSYWIPKLTKDLVLSGYYFVGLVEREELDRIEEIQFSQDPDNFIRLRFVFEALPGPQSVQLEDSLPTPVLPELSLRSGFTAVDWGGIIINGSCEDGTVQNVISR